MGKYASQFEAKIAALFAKKHGIFVNSGSSALYIGMEAMGFKAGGEVITPALTFSTTVGCIVKNGLVPVFVDVGTNDYCIDVSKIEEMITPKTVAILAPNLLGNLCEWDKIGEIAKRHNLKVIEDSADTLGATLHGKSSGHWSDWSITSFYGSHIINCAGNGGCWCLTIPTSCARQNCCAAGGAPPRFSTRRARRLKTASTWMWTAWNMTPSSFSRASATIWKGRKSAPPSDWCS